MCGVERERELRPSVSRKISPSSSMPTWMSKPAQLLVSVLISSASARFAVATTFMVMNGCDFTVWPGILPNAGQEVLEGGGFELRAGEGRAVQAPAGWSGRMWGRSGCAFNTGGGGSCASGDCAGGQLECAGTGAQPPVTLAEFTLASATSLASSTSGSAALDFYDVSLVDGFNLPLAVTPSTVTQATAGSAAESTSAYSCGVASCAANLTSSCPAALQVVDGASGGVVSCKSACLAFQSPQYCCSGSYANPTTCSPSSYSELFKSACPTAYSYAYDDPTSTFTCPSAAQYAITFCPSATSSSSQKASSRGAPNGSMSAGASRSAAATWLVLRWGGASTTIIIWTAVFSILAR